jgi:hypothetical protein
MATNAKDCKMHKWQLMAVSSKVWVTCLHCPARFQFTHEYNGAGYSGKIPATYQHLPEAFR